MPEVFRPFPWAHFPPASLRQRVLTLVDTFLRPGDGVVVAFSGGADSMFLLWMVWHLARMRRIAPVGAYLNHRQRPDAPQEEAFAREVLRTWGYPRVMGRVRSTFPANVEHRLRRIRYTFLHRVRRRYGARWILTAHTASDQVETLLLQLQRGGGGWLTGIPVVHRHVLRPLLLLTREEIRQALQEAGFPWYEDPSNRDPRFARNRLRLLTELLGSPLPIARQTLSRQHTLRVLRNRGGMLLTAALLPSLPGSLRLDRTAWSGYDKVLVSLALTARVPRLRGAVFSLEKLLERPVGTLPWKGYTVQVDEREVWIGPSFHFPSCVLREGVYRVPSLNLVFRVTPSSRGTVPRGPWDLRGSRPGDRLGDRPLRALLRRRGVPRWAWDVWPVVARGTEVLWALGFHPRYRGPGYRIEVEKHDRESFGISDLT